MTGKTRIILVAQAVGAATGAQTPYVIGVGPYPALMAAYPGPSYEEASQPESVQVKSVKDRFPGELTNY